MGNTERGSTFWVGVEDIMATKRRARKGHDRKDEEVTWVITGNARRRGRRRRTEGELGVRAPSETD